jgi:hypothetical protein
MGLTHEKNSMVLSLRRAPHRWRMAGLRHPRRLCPDARAQSRYTYAPGRDPAQRQRGGGAIGYAALRADFFHGAGNWDVNVSAGIPTFGDRWLHGYNQSLGFDLRVPFRIRLAQWSRGTGSLKLGPYFHAGRGACGPRYDCPGPGCGRCPGPGCAEPRNCETRAIGTGVLFGFVADIALPKLFKIIVGIEQQFGLLNWRYAPTDYTHNYFAGATWLDLGLEAFWRESLFFTMIMNVGAQYGSDSLHYRDHALFRQLFGVGYKFR